MSLYHEAASVLTKSKAEGVSIQTTVFAKKNWKSPAKVLFALSSEAAKWSSVLSEVVENSDILRSEKQLTPVLAIVLVHDALLAKKGVSLPQNHGLNACVRRNKARLSAELTKTRIRRACSTIDQLRAKVEQEAQNPAAEAESESSIIHKHPRWIRINTVISSQTEQLASTFSGFTEVESINEILQASRGQKVVFIDAHIPNLVAIPPSVDLTSSKAYREGQIIFQDKASCFPAYLMDPQAGQGDIVDACAAPGNKTTHLAAILHSSMQQDVQHDAAQHIFACEKDPLRSKTLSKMVALAGADELVRIMQNQNFLKLQPSDMQFANVTKLLLDPSCSGSGIVKRDQGAIAVHLPTIRDASSSKGRKRKRDSKAVAEVAEEIIVEEDVVVEEAEVEDAEKLKGRLNNLADFQLRLLQHAMEFAAATQISYSTCSIHAEENEGVVIRALQSDVAIRRGWTVQRRTEQVPGIQKWHTRGDLAAVKSLLPNDNLNTGLSAQVIAEACVRCDKKGADGTMGFFVAGFVRSKVHSNGNGRMSINNNDDDWTGFDDT